MRDIKFRGLDLEHDYWVYGSLINYDPIPEIQSTEIGGNDYDYPSNEVKPETVGQYTGLKDKNGVEIYEGDIIRFKRPYRKTQTHTGDNIPNGSYTEPMECAIEINEFAVVFKDGCFASGDEKEFDMPISWLDNNHDEESLKDAVSWRDSQKDFWADPEEGDLQYLLDEYNLSNINELLDFINGIEVIGNVHENPELLNQ